VEGDSSVLVAGKDGLAGLTPYDGKHEKHTKNIFLQTNENCALEQKKFYGVHGIKNSAHKKAARLTGRLI
jgi:hypothetical protein